MFKRAASQVSRPINQQRERISSIATEGTIRRTARMTQTQQSASSKRKMDDGEEEEEMQVFKVVRRVGQDEIPTVGTSNAGGPSASKAKGKGSTITSFFGRSSDSTKGDASAMVEASGSNSGVTWPVEGLGPDGLCHVGVYKDPFATALAHSPSDKATHQKVAAFDLDGTLIETKSGRAAYNFADEYDFKIWGRTPNDRNGVKEKLLSESREGSLIVIITSQFNRTGAKLKLWKTRMSHIMRALDVPAVVIVSLGKDAYRKPNAGWADHLRYLWKSKGGVLPLDMGVDSTTQANDKTRSFFVGDAAGRTASGSRKEDFADTDRKLALNLHWQFLTPEEYFLSEKPMKCTLSGYSPSVRSAESKSRLTALSEARAKLLDPTKSTQKTVAILVGPQASGKSHLATSIESSSGGGQWVRVNQDLLKTRNKCLTVAREALQSGKSVVVDNTNPTRDVRALWTKLAREEGATRVVCVHFDLTLEEATHNDNYRSKRWLHAAWDPSSEDAPELPKLPRPMPGVAFATYFKSLARPDLNKEDLDEIYTVGVEFEGSELERRAWNMWYA